VTSDIRVYRIPRRQAFFAVGVVVAFLVCASLIFEPDPSTGVLSKPSDYLWVLIPSALLAVYLTARARRTRVETSPAGITMFHVMNSEHVPWADVVGFEVHPTPSRRGSTVLARTALGRLVRVRTFMGVRRTTDHRARATEFRDQLEADREDRVARVPGSGAAFESLAG
jgi:hypothetical protein